MSPVELSEVIRNYAIVVGGAIGLALAIWRGIAADRQSKASRERAETARRTHVTEVLNEAIGHLGDKKLEIRLGAIYALRMITEDFPETLGWITELLSAYARERKPLPGEKVLPVDVREIIDFLRTSLSKEHVDG